ncbi:MAG: LysR family transcriptional regulator [Halobacteriovoraceae bacterium]|nr:LysR family transcriptional regulator [Halobacteriovoraceae bacterium]|tara:strand:+ start:86510 stop:87394 length:885 start_codon:yes stop_codon:yes gene_type:complete
MIKWLNYHHLLYFRTIATEGSISRASEKLSVGQSALSSQLKQLEESVGQQLFLRKGRKMELTEAGKVALQYAEEIFQKGEEFVQIFNNKSLSFQSKYRIGICDTAPKTLSCKLIEAAQNAGEDTFLSVVEGEPENLIEKLMSHKLELVLSNGGVNARQQGIFEKRVGEFKVSIYGSEEYKDLKSDFPNSLNEMGFILPTTHSKLRYDIEHSFQQNKIKYKLLAEVQDSSLKKMLAENGKGLIFLSDFAAMPLVEEGKLHEIGRLGELKEEYFLYSVQRTLPNPITEFLINDFLV